MANDGSLIAFVFARQFLQQKFDIPEFDAAAKPQGVPELDVDVQTSNQERIIAEIKTMVPCGENGRDLGANQNKTFLENFRKLVANEARHNFFFVTNQRTHDAVSKRYGEWLREHHIKLKWLDG